jgi:hypothetical protein
VSDSKGAPRPARPSPLSLLIDQVAAVLRAEFAASYAGIGYANDGSVEVYSTGDPALPEVVARIWAAGGGTVPVHVIAGMQNSLAELRELVDQIGARRKDLATRGIQVLNCGIDSRANRVTIGVANLTPDTHAYLVHEFGPDRVIVKEGQRFYAVPGSA